MGVVYNQLNHEWKVKQAQWRYGAAKGGLSALRAGIGAVGSFLWRRPTALAYFVAAVMSSALFNHVLVLPAALTFFIGMVVVFDAMTNGDVVSRTRRRIRSRRTRLILTGSWSNTVTDLGLFSLVDRRGQRIAVLPKLVQIQERH